MNRWLFSTLAAVCLAGLVAPARAQAPRQTTDDDFGAPSVTEEERASRKTPSFFHRPEEKTPAAQLALADALRAKGKLRKAAGEYRALVHEWHDAAEAPVAQRAYATVLLERRKFEQAFKEFQYLIEYFPGRAAYSDIIKTQYEIANTLRTERVGGFLFLPGLHSPDRAVPLYEQIVRNAPSWDRAPECQYLVGWIQEDEGNFEEAYLAYEKVAIVYPASDRAVSAAFRRGVCLYELAKASPRDDHEAQRALVALLDYVRKFPREPDVEQAQQYVEELKQRLAENYYGVALYYDQIARRPRAAAAAYEDFIGRFPTSDKVQAAQDRLAELEKSLAREESAKQQEGSHAKP